MPAGQPSRIGRYTVQRVLGRGGMGTVYLAVDPLIEREVAIKVLPLAGADEYSDRLIAEARVSGRLIHPNIVGVFDVGEEHGQPFVVMPYVPGRTVASILTDRDRPPIATKLRWMVQLCDALAYAHERRVIHRDIKPTNLLIDDQQNLRVLDFGIAKVLTTSQIQFTSVGTPAYMAPEQYSSDPVDPRTDVFAAGLVFYELITHRRALTGTTPAQIYGQLMAGPLPRVLDAAPDTDPALAAVCEQAMSRHPGDRFQTARALGDALLGIGTASAATTTAITLVGVPAPAPPVLREPDTPVLAVDRAPALVPDPVPAAAAVPDPVPAAATRRIPPPAARNISSPAPADDVPWQRPGVSPLPEGRRIILALAVAGVAVVAVVLVGRNRLANAAPPASGRPVEAAHTYAQTPELRVRHAITWGVGVQGPGCTARMRGAPSAFGDPPVLFHLTATRCDKDGAPDMAARALFRETPAGILKLIDDDTPQSQMAQGFGYGVALDGSRVSIIGPKGWTFVRVADGGEERRVEPAPGIMVGRSDEGAVVVYAHEQDLGLFDVRTGSASRFVVTTDGMPPNAEIQFSEISATGRYVVFTSAATNLFGGSDAGTNALYRYDRETNALLIVNPDVGQLEHGLAITVAIGRDGDWIAYTTLQRHGHAASPPSDKIFLYAYQASIGRTQLVDSIDKPASLGDTYLGALTMIDANLLVFQRDGGQTASKREYTWVALPDGERRTEVLDKAQMTANQAFPRPVAPRCLSRGDLSAWCVDP